MSVFDPLAVKMALAPFAMFIILIGIFIYFKNSKR